MSNDTEIRELITGWVDAIVACDLDGVLARHDDDIVMFDVPPPYNGIRGMKEYREAWPPFFEYIRKGAQFEVVELDVTAGDDVAFARALLICGTEDDRKDKPDNRLRLTIGLRKKGDGWVVTHEHHSFPLHD